MSDPSQINIVKVKERIQNAYPVILQKMLQEIGVQPLKAAPHYIVPSDVGYTIALQHTQWYMSEGDSKPHYRFRRYVALIYQILEESEYAQYVNIDIGCGAGAFAWAFTGSVAEKTNQVDSIQLHGYDYAPNMVQLANDVHKRLVNDVNGYPNAYYNSNVDACTDDITANAVDNSLYVITIGHALVQARDKNIIDEIVQIVREIFGIADSASKVVLIAADAKSQSRIFNEEWCKLLQQLKKWVL